MMRAEAAEARMEALVASARKLDDEIRRADRADAAEEWRKREAATRDEMTRREDKMDAELDAALAQLSGKRTAAGKRSVTL